MIALKIAEVKDFMNKLLCQDVFDHFLIQEAVITTNVSCHIDGTLQKDFYTLEELEEQNLTGLSFVPYGLLRSSCFNLIKGKKTVLKYPLPEWRTDRDHGYLLPDLLDRQNS